MNLVGTLSSEAIAYVGVRVGVLARARHASDAMLTFLRRYFGAAGKLGVDALAGFVPTKEDLSSFR